MDSQRHPADQSFLLRFWYEPSEFLAAHWRGSVWHYQAPEVGHQPVAGPEEAFEIVRHALAAADPACGIPSEEVRQAAPPEAGEPPPGRRRPLAWADVLRVVRKRIGRFRR